MSEQMSNEQFQQLMTRLDHIEGNMVKKSDVFQSVLTVQGFMFAIDNQELVRLDAFASHQ